MALRADKADIRKSSSAHSIERIVGASPWSQQIRAEIQRLARYSSSVLVMGPSGSGKELIARAIHAESPRVSSPFIPIDCASITGTLFASHMFGHVQGAFTGATHAALGGFRAADGGTIFLDEIGELEHDLQAKLLRVLQERAVVPVGSYQEVPVDVRVIAATNRDLGAEVGAGNFREDLYYRLNVVSLTSEPLRNRPEDIELLARHIFAKLAVRHGMPLKHLSPMALDRLSSYAWPGNVRQLENALERAALYSEFDEVGPQDLPALDHPTSGHPGLAGAQTSDPPISDPPKRDLFAPTPPIAADSIIADQHDWKSISDVEREHILRTLEHTYFNQSAAARLLRIDRNLLRRKINRYGIEVPDHRRSRRPR